MAKQRTQRITRAPKRGQALTPAQETFCAEYVLNGGNASAAYREAFPRSRNWKAYTVNARASELLSHSKIQERVEALKAKAKKKIERKFDITLDQVLNELASIAFANMRDFLKFDDEGNPTVDLSSVSREQFAAVQEVTIEDIVSGPRQGTRTKFKLGDKKAALVKLGEHLGGFKQTIVNEHHVIDDAADALERKLAELSANIGTTKDSRSVH